MDMEADMLEEAAPARKAQKRYEAYKKDKGRSLGAESGSTAVQVADAVKEMKTAEGEASMADDIAGIRYLAGHAFKYGNGGWVDLKYKPSMKVLKVKYLGKAYFKLIKKSKKLKTILSLGQRITIVVDKNHALVISPDGQEDVSDRELNKYLP